MNKQKRADVYVGLVHWPVLNRSGEKIATTVTHFDIHDIARACRTFGVKKYFIINRLQEQLMYVSRVLSHWHSGDGAGINAKRESALSLVEPVETVAEALKRIGGQQAPMIIATAARTMAAGASISFKEIRESIENNGETPVLLLFGTGSGLHQEVISPEMQLLEPIMGAAEDQFRHLSVRSAVSICLDRILGAW